MVKNNKHKKQQYLAPTIAVFDIVENNYLLAASPNARPGGDGKPAGNITLSSQDTTMEGIVITLRGKFLG